MFFHYSFLLELRFQPAKSMKIERFLVVAKYDLNNYNNTYSGHRSFFKAQPLNTLQGSF